MDLARLKKACRDKIEVGCLREFVLMDPLEILALVDVAEAAQALSKWRRGTLLEPKLADGLLRALDDALKGIE